MSVVSVNWEAFEISPQLGNFWHFHFPSIFYCAIYLDRKCCDSDKVPPQFIVYFTAQVYFVLLYSSNFARKFKPVSNVALPIPRKYRIRVLGFCNKLSFYCVMRRLLKCLTMPKWYSYISFFKYQTIFLFGLFTFSFQTCQILLFDRFMSSTEWVDAILLG